nr:MAG TPA: Large polyvalent protein associated domain 23 [Caudoviricetes sp.]
MGRLVKANPEVEASKGQTTVVGTGTHGRLVRTGDVQRTSPAGNVVQKKPTVQPSKAATTPAKASSPMSRTQQNVVAPKNQSALAQNLAKGALQQQSAKNYQSTEALEQHAQEVKPRTTMQRVGDTVKGAAKTYASGLVNLVGMAQTGSGLQQRTAADEEIALWDQEIKTQQGVLADPKSTKIERETAKNVIDALELRRAAYLKAYGEGGAVEQAAQGIYKTADKLADSGTRDIERAKKDLGGVGRLAVDVGVAGAQMGADAALGLLTGGSALPAMFVRSTGGSAQEARRAGATHQQQVDYGFASGALSVATEKIGNAAAPFKKMFGKGFLDDVIERATQNLTRSAAGKIALSFLEEGGEEVLEDLIQPALQTIYNGKTMGGSYSELEAAEVLNDFLVGGILGGLGGGVEVAANRFSGFDSTIGENGQKAIRGSYQEGTDAAAHSAEFLAAYNAGKEGKPNPNKESATAYAGYIAGQNDAKAEAGTGEHIDSRTKENVTSRNVNAFQFDHPELHSYYSAAAEQIAGIADMSLSRGQQKGARQRTANGYQRSNQIFETPAMRKAMDEGMSRTQIIDAAQRIINDNGQENVKAAKTLEIVLDDMLTNGYTAVDGTAVAPNTDYIAAKQQIAGAEVQATGFDKYVTDNRLALETGEVTMDELRAEYAQQEGAEHGEAVHLRDGSERDNGANPRGEVRGVEESTGRDQSRKKGRHFADSEAAALDYGEKVSTASFGIGRGAVNDSVYLVKNETKEMRKAKDLAKERGLRVTFFAGNNLTFRSKNGKTFQARGYVSGDRVFIRADHPEFTSYQIMRHEAGHDMIAKGEVDLNEVRTRIDKTFTSGEVGSLCTAYADAYAGTEMTAQEIWEEIVCDSLGDMNIFADSEISDAAAFLLAHIKVESETVVQENSRAPPSGTGPVREKFSYAGEKAKNADKAALNTAKEMEKNGADAETIRQKTGWFRGADGKWRWEIDDSGMEYRRDGDAQLLNEPEYRRLQELTGKWAKSFEENGAPLSASEEAEMDELRETYSDRVWDEKYLLRDFLKHDELFKEYPYLNRVSLVFDELGYGEKGFFDRRSNTIVLSDSLIGTAEDTLIHEIQHVIQKIEGFAGGSSPKYWNERMENGYSKRWASGEEMMPSELYRNTAGEIEARDAAARRSLTAEERRGRKPDTGDENTVFADSGESYELVGKNKDGIEVYETGEDIKKMSYKERMETFLDIMRNEYAGRTAKFSDGNNTYYAKFDEADLRKNVYGDKKSSQKGWKAKINTGANGSIFELVENATYSGGKTEQGKKSQAHRNLTGWEYFVKTVQIDGQVYDLLANVRKKPDGEFVYSIQLNENKNKASAPPLQYQNGTAKANDRPVGVSTNASNGSVPQNGGNVNGVNDAQFSREIPEANYEALKEKYGYIPAGERAYREVQVPKKTADDKYVSRTIRTVLEAKATPNAMVPTIERMVEKGDFSYDRYTDKQAISDAESRIKTEGWQKTLNKWKSSTKEGISKENTAIGWALYNNAANSGDVETAIDVLDTIVKRQRNAAQALQATRLLKQQDPSTQLYAAQRSVENLTEDLKKQYGEKAPDLKIDRDLAEKFLNAKDDDARTEAMKEIYRDIGRQMPSRFIDKWNAWRYLSMLGNPRTHVRNIVGNVGFVPAVTVKNVIGAGIESAANAVSGGKVGRTKAILTTKDAGLIKAAWSDYANIREQALGSGKYNDNVNVRQEIEEGRTVFKLKPLEAMRKFNGTALDAEDAWFSKPHYAAALAQFCKANGITAEQVFGGKGIEAAREYAIREAQKATYRDTNAFSQMISDLGRYRGDNKMKRLGSTLAEGILPFRKTPANILVRGVEYSPIGFLKSISYDLVQVQKGNMQATEMIDRAAAGLTGTGLMMLGLYMAKEGILRGSGGDDEKKKKFDELQGHQEYAMELPNGTSITLDWLAPEALPFFVGANLYEQMQANNGYLTMSDMLQAASNVTDPLLSMSCLQSLNDVFDAVGYASSGDTNALTSAVASAATSYLTQGIPTVFGQAERTGESTRMTTYTDKNKFLTPDMQYALGKASARIPGVDYGQIPFIDAWGRTENSGGVVARAFNNFANPAYTSKVSGSKMEDELSRLYEATGESKVLPQRAPKSFTVNKENKQLTGEEYVKYATKRGQTSYKIVSELTGLASYKSMSDGDKADAVAKAYEYANIVGKMSVSNYQTDGWAAKAIDTVKKTGISEAQYIALYLAKGGIESLKDKNGDTISNSEGLQIMELVYQQKGLSDKQRAALFEDFGVGKSIRHWNRARVDEQLKIARRKAA